MLRQYPCSFCEYIMTGVHAPKRSYIQLFIHLHTLHMVRQCVVRGGFQVAPTGLSICIQTFATCISNASYARKTGSCRHIVCLCRIMINMLWIVNLFGQIATVVSGYLNQNFFSSRSGDL